MSTASENRRRKLTIALGLASAITFGGMYGVIAKSAGTGGGSDTQAAALVLDQSAYTDLTTPDATVAPVVRSSDEDDGEGAYEGGEDDEGESRASVATTAPTTAPTRAPTPAPTAAPTPVTKTRGS